MIEHEFGDDAQAPLVGQIEEGAEVFEGAVARIHREVVRDVVAIVPERRGIEREQPEGGDTKFGEIIQSLDQTPEVAEAVAIAVLERFDVKFVNDRVFVPERVRHH